MDRAALARLEHENLIATLALAGSNADRAMIRRADGVALIATGLPLRLFNQVLVEGDEATAVAIAAAVDVTRERGDRFVVNLQVGPDDRFVALMGQLGLVPLSDGPWMPGMALYPLSAQAPGSAEGPRATRLGHEIRQVTDGAGVEDHIRTAAAGFEMPEEILRQVMSMALVGRRGVAVYVGYTDGQPLTTGLGVRTGRTIGVYNIATIPSARKRGYGAAMTTRIAEDGATDGCDVAVLQASEMGYPIYERLGYRTVVEYMGYVDPPSVEPSESPGA